MQQKHWQKIMLAQGNEHPLWELFHENSKISTYGNSFLSDKEILARIKELYESLPFWGYPVVKLPRQLMSLNRPLDQAISARTSVREMEPCPLTLQQIATLFHYAYGETRDNKETNFPRPFRVVPSGGGLYPLEIFFYCTKSKGLKAGVYHYNPAEKTLCLLSEGDHAQKISKAMVQPEIALGAALIVFITAIFERSVFKYGDRGYRFVFLEAGHVAQNMNLVANALGFGCVNIGGFFDREVDDLLGLDGVTHSTIYMVALGKQA